MQSYLSEEFVDAQSFLFAEFVVLFKSRSCWLLLTPFLSCRVFKCENLRHLQQSVAMYFKMQVLSVLSWPYIIVRWSWVGIENGKLILTHVNIKLLSELLIGNHFHVRWTAVQLHSQQRAVGLYSKLKHLYRYYIFIYSFIEVEWIDTTAKNRIV